MPLGSLGAGVTAGGVDGAAGTVGVVDGADGSTVGLGAVLVNC